MKPLFESIMERIRYNKKKRELKRAFRRKPKPARVIIKDDDAIKKHFGVKE